MRVKTIAGLSVVLSSLLAACGGGGGGGATPPVSGNPSPGSTATPTPQATANVSGTVVKLGDSSPLSGVQVALAPWTAGATPVPMATTNASGQFSFTATPGHYLLVVGSNSATDTWATLHESVTLNGGSNVLTGQTPPPAPLPQVTPFPSETSGALRLATLDTARQDCLTGANQGRTLLSLPLLVPDEYLEEDAMATNSEEFGQNTDTPNPLFSTTQPFGSDSGMTTSVDFTSCSSWTGSSYSYVAGNPPYPLATSATNIWYGAGFVIGTEPGGINASFGAQFWAQDPR